VLKGRFEGRNLIFYYLQITGTAWNGPEPNMIYISVEMEGVAGVVTGDQLNPSSFDYKLAARPNECSMFVPD
jgi:hypothetical protein